MKMPRRLFMAVSVEKLKNGVEAKFATEPAALEHVKEHA
jgi:hypothetical protein